MSWWRRLLEAIRRLFKPKPEPEPDPGKHVNEGSEGYRIRLKTYDPPHKQRLGRQLSVGRRPLGVSLAARRA